jgi:hypothetical protein
MTPFNLERVQAGDPMVTRDGRNAKFGAYNPDVEADQQLVVWVGNDVIVSRLDGYHYENGQPPSPYDLFMAPKKRTLWIGVGRNKHFTSEFSTTGVCEDRDTAAAVVANWTRYDLIGVFPIEIEE